MKKKKIALLFFLTFCTFIHKSFAQLDSIYFEKAKKYIENNELEKSIILLDKAIKINPHQARYFEEKAFSLHQLKRHQEAIDCMNTGVEQNPNNPHFLVARSLVFFFNSKFRVAMMDCNKALKLIQEDDPLKVQLLLNRSNCKVYLNLKESALKDLEKILTIDSLSREALINMGTTHMSMEEYTIAMEYFTKADHHYPNDYLILMNLGFLFSKTQQFRKAVGILNKAIALEPDLAVSYNNRGFAYLKLGKLKEAEIDINKSLDLYPENSYAHRNKALFFLEKKEHQKTCESLEKALYYGFSDQYGDEVQQLFEKHCK